MNDKEYDDYDETANFAPGYYEDEEENFIYDILNSLARYSTFFDSADLGRTIDNLKVVIERYSYILENSVMEETDSEIVIAVNGFNYDVFDFIGKFFVDEYGNELTLEYLVNQLDEEEAELIGDIFGIDVNDLIEGLILTLGVEEREFDEHYVDYYYAMIGCSQGTVLEIAIAADLYEETETYVITAEDIAGASDNSHYVTQEERDENGDWYITEISDAQFMLEDLLKAFLDYGKR